MERNKITYNKKKEELKWHKIFKEENQKEVWEALKTIMEDINDRNKKSPPIYDPEKLEELRELDRMLEENPNRSDEEKKEILEKFGFHEITDEECEYQEVVDVPFNRRKK